MVPEPPKDRRRLQWVLVLQIDLEEQELPMVLGEREHPKDLGEPVHRDLHLEEPLKEERERPPKVRDRRN